MKPINFSLVAEFDLRDGVYQWQGTATYHNGTTCTFSDAFLCQLLRKVASNIEYGGRIQ